MEQFIDTNLDVYGPIAVFILLMLSGIGLALGEEMVTVPAGVLIATGRLDFWVTAAVAYVGIVLADFMWFGICRHYGTMLLHRRWMKRFIHPHRLLQAKHQFDHRGVWLIVMARFIPSSRSTAITVSGMFQMPFWQFALTTAGCVLITVPLQLGLGYLVGLGLDEKKSLADLFLNILGIVLLLVVVMLLLGWLNRARASGRRFPRARASWLRRFRRPSNNQVSLNTDAAREALIQEAATPTPVNTAVDSTETEKAAV